MKTAVGLRGRRMGAGAILLLLPVVCSSNVRAQVDPPDPPSSQAILNTMLAHEGVAAQRKDHYTYLSQERSERTGGHLWTERVVETPVGKIRFLLGEDGHPLDAQREAQERGRLAAIIANPASFEKAELAMRNDEDHSRQMLLTLPKAFLLSEARMEGGYLRIDYKPDPNYSPRSLEERVLHGMSGYMLIDPREIRLRHIEGRLAQDVSIGFGFLATIRAGSNFSTTREKVGDPAALEWKTTLIHTDIDGKAIFFKVISKKEDAEHTQFVRVPNDLTVAQAVALAER